MCMLLLYMKPVPKSFECANNKKKKSGNEYYVLVNIYSGNSILTNTSTKQLCTDSRNQPLKCVHGIFHNIKILKNVSNLVYITANILINQTLLLIRLFRLLLYLG